MAQSLVLARYWTALCSRTLAERGERSAREADEAILVLVKIPASAQSISLGARVSMRLPQQVLRIALAIFLLPLVSVLLGFALATATSS